MHKIEIQLEEKLYRLLQTEAAHQRRPVEDLIHTILAHHVMEHNIAPEDWHIEYDSAHPHALHRQ